mmetsp:Transcript_51256/g.133897  ORF Transcript_51256/g.133897 Transcript_51256/m.133897 type:complete len:86 (+) Transcript_51256:131-388(+)
MAFPVALERLLCFCVFLGPGMSQNSSAGTEQVNMNSNDDVGNLAQLLGCPGISSQQATTPMDSFDETLEWLSPSPWNDYFASVYF